MEVHEGGISIFEDRGQFLSKFSPGGSFRDSRARYRHTTQFGGKHSFQS